jgi:hypothetical protein
LQESRVSFTGSKKVEFRLPIHNKKANGSKTTQKKNYSIQYLIVLFGAGCHNNDEEDVGDDVVVVYERIVYNNTDRRSQQRHYYTISYTDISSHCRFYFFPYGIADSFTIYRSVGPSIYPSYHSTFRHSNRSAI